jgi:hypothetical protein
VAAGIIVYDFKAAQAEALAAGIEAEERESVLAATCRPQDEPGRTGRPARNPIGAVGEDRREVETAERVHGRESPLEDRPIPVLDQEIGVAALRRQPGDGAVEPRLVEQITREACWPGAPCRDQAR